MAYIPCTNLEVNPLLKACGCASLVSVKKCPLLPCWTSWRKKLAQNCVRSALLSRDLIKVFDVIISKRKRRRKPKVSSAKKHDPHSESDEQKSSEMDGLLHCVVRNSSARLLFTTKNPMRDPPRPPRSYEIIRAHEMLLAHRDRCKTVSLPCAFVACFWAWRIGLVRRF